METRAALLIAVATACGSGGHAETRIERALREAVTAAVGTPVTRVACATASRCVATIAKVEVPLAIHDAGTELGWEIAGLVVSAAMLETEVQALLEDVGVVATVDCGARVRVAQPGDRIACTLAASSGPGEAWATLAADGTAELELALDGGAVKARSEDISDVTLDALSRALDRDPGDQAEGDLEADEPAPDSDARP